MEKIIQRIKEYEGYRDKPYQCTAKKWTIGFGYNYEDRGFETADITRILISGFTQELAEKLLTKDVEQCVKQASAFPFFNSMNDARRAVVIDMIYQLGIGGFKAFKKMIERLEKGDWKGAALEMIHSRWYTQSGRRSRTNVKQMEEGTWQEVK
jgi:lysozyme